MGGDTGFTIPNHVSETIMKPYSRLLYFTIAACSLITPCTSTNAATFGSKENHIVFQNMPTPGVIDSLYLDVNGEVAITLAVLFDDQGIVNDWMPLHTNDIKMVDYIAGVIKEWKMYPPLDADGQPQWSYYEFELKLKNDSVILNLTVMESVMNFFDLQKGEIYLVVPFQKLDTPPKLLKGSQPELPRELLQKNSGQTLEIQCFIDKNGNVRLPVIKQSDLEPAVKGILLDTLLSWNFEPPMLKETPVATRAIIPFKLP